MAERFEIIFAGVGGQGLLLSANVLGKAVAIRGKKQAVMSCAYGTESRGTFTKADLIISNERIDFPEVLEADAVVALAQVAYDHYFADMKPGSVLLYDSSSIQERESAAKQYALPLSELAETGGSKASLNVAALGALLALTDCADKESVRQTLAKQFKGKEKVVEINDHVFESGYARAKMLITY